VARVCGMPMKEAHVFKTYDQCWEWITLLHSTEQRFKDGSNVERMYLVWTVLSVWKMISGLK